MGGGDGGGVAAAAAAVKGQHNTRPGLKCETSVQLLGRWTSSGESGAWGGAGVSAVRGGGSAARRPQLAHAFQDAPLKAPALISNS